MFFKKKVKHISKKDILDKIEELKNNVRCSVELNDILREVWERIDNNRYELSINQENQFKRIFEESDFKNSYYNEFNLKRYINLIKDITENNYIEKAEDEDSENKINQTKAQIKKNSEAIRTNKREIEKLKDYNEIEAYKKENSYLEKENERLLNYLDYLLSEKEDKQIKNHNKKI